MNPFFVLSAVIIVICDQCSAQVLPDKILDTDDGYRIERFDTIVDNYNAAKENCEERGISYIEEGWIVRIKDEVTQKQVENVTRAKNEGDDANENCAYLFGNDGTWFDIPCDTRLSFICQSDLIFIQAAKTEIIQLEEQSVELSAIVATQEDPVIANLYKLPDTETSLQNITATKNQLGVELNYPIDSLNSSMDAGEYLFVVTTETTKDYNRTSTTKISVHVPADIISVDPQSIHSPVTVGPDQVYCLAQGTPSPEVKWLRCDNSMEVYKNETADGVYQTFEETAAILHVEYASLNDHGVYTCEATNVVTTSNLIKKDTHDIILTVLGPPSITDYSVNKCEETSSITVTWRPNENTRNIDHSVSVADIKSDDVLYTMTVHPNGQETISTFISDGLMAATTYNILITVCPDICIPYLNDSTLVTTAGGLSNPVTNGTVGQRDFECVVRWEWTGVYPNEEVSFVVQEDVLLVYQNIENGSEFVILDTINCNDGMLECSGRSYQTTRKTKPNREYKYTITTRTCSGDSLEVPAVGECVTENAGPSVVPPAESLGRKGDFQQIFVTAPVETNGPISCIFVVLVKEENPTLTTEFNENILEIFSEAAKDGDLQSNVEYLSVAILKSAINDSGLIINLGDDRITSCNPEIISDSRAADYIAVNRELQIDVFYTYYTLASTPYRTKPGAIFQRSDSTVFQISNENNGTPVGAIVGGIVGGLLIIAVAIGAIYYWRTRKVNSTATSQNTSPPPLPMSIPTRESPRADFAVSSLPGRTNVTRNNEYADEIPSDQQQEDEEGIYQN